MELSLRLARVRCVAPRLSTLGILFALWLGGSVWTASPACAQFTGEQVVGEATAVVGGAGLPQVMVEGRRFYVVYDTPSGSQRKLRVAVSVNAARSWRPDHEIGVARGAHAAADEYRALVAFTTAGPGGSGVRVFAETTRDAGASWTRALLSETSSGALVGAPFAIVDGTSMYVLWSESDGGAVSHHVQVSTSGGQTWLAAPRDGVPLRDGYKGGAAASGTSVVVVHDHDFYRSDDRGITWSAPEPLPIHYGDLPFPLAASVLLDADDTVTVVTDTLLYNTQFSSRVSHVLVSPDGGSTWTENRVGSADPRMTRSADRIVLTSVARIPLNDGSHSIMNTSFDGGVTFGSFRYVAFTCDNEFCERTNADHADFDKRIVSVYREVCSGSAAQLYATTSFADAGLWTPPFALRRDAPAAIDSNDIDFAHDASSCCAALVWVEKRDGIARVWLNGGALAAADPIACRAGNVDSTLGPADDVLFLNGSAGVGPERLIGLASSDPFVLALERPASESGETDELEYAMFFWTSSPSVSTTRVLPKNVGAMCMPVSPLPRAGDPIPEVRLNTIGFDGKIGAETEPSPMAPGVIYDVRPFMAFCGVRMFVQGFVRNASCPNGTVAVTNGIEVWL